MGVRPLTVNSEQINNSDKLCGLLLRWEIVPWQVWKKEITLTFQRFVITDAKRQQRGSVKVKSDLH